MVVTNLEIECVQPNEGILPFQGAVAKRLHHLVELLADAGDPALPGTARQGRCVDPGQSQSLQQIVHSPGTDPFDIGLLHHRQERLLRPPPGLQQAREVGPVAHLGNTQRDLSHACLPHPLPMTVAVSPALRGALVAAGPNLLGCLQLHDRLGQPLQAFLQESLIGFQTNIAQILHQCHTVPVSLRDSRSVIVCSLFGLPITQGSTRWPFSQAIFTPLHETLSLPKCAPALSVTRAA
jgi:hypothetical protein